MDTRPLILAALLFTSSQLSAAPVPESPRELGTHAPEGNGKFPRIGETLEELTAHYGIGKKNAGKIRIRGDDEYYWEMRGLGVNVVMQDGKAVMLVVHEVGRKISESDIHDFLAANGEGRGWHPDGLRWVSGDKQLEAFREKNHHDMFFVEDIAVVEKSPRPPIPGGR